MKSVNQLVAEIKESGQDFEWYPTTTEIVDALALKLKTWSDEEWRYKNRVVNSILDIGCGNGGFFEKLCKDEDFKNVKKYGIEKSMILSEQLPDDVILLGTDFNQQTLIDKKVDILFCNPPYSEYDTWAEKIILQGNCNAIVLVIPNRWANNERIKYALERRNMQAEVIGTYDFLNAERKARATVDLLFISARESVMNGRKYDENIKDPFELWFDETFKINAETNKYKTKYDSDIKEEIKNELTVKGDTAEMLVQFYNRDMEKLYNNYRKLEELDADIFDELKVNVPNLKESLKTRLQGLKHIYWDLLFQRYDKVTSRLTSKGRKKVINRLNDNTAIDFTIENIFQLTLWIIKHSNTLFDEQITEYFYSLCNTENIYRYKSNKRWSDDDWRYIKENLTEYGHLKRDKVNQLKNILLDYRIIVTAYSNFDTSWRNRLSDSCRDFLSDTVIIGKNLGFDIDFELPAASDEINISDWNNFNIYTKDSKIFANVKLYKNGNRHVKFCKEFMQKLNVEMARINGWVQDKSEAVKEMDIPADVINSVWKTNLQIGIESGKKLLGLPEA